MSDDRRFKTAWDVAKWIEANVLDLREQGHRDPMDAALWWWAAQQVETIHDLNGRELIEMFRDGIQRAHPDDIAKDIAARYEDLQEDESIAEKDTAVDGEIENLLINFWQR